ncbi:axoneme-associated protein mst101(2)-like [Neodiprion pinetum]|uniref:axoneme-associated protein mst101(2)-like n=1 Tax=Neodiprion pinetum TaxID=441929 RepID=UPI001EDE9F15|nr:myb-like protein X isoform X3 [Neodiprion pinetum]
MYKSAVILVALIGTACAFPPADILRKSVAEDNVDEKAPETLSQVSEVENQREDDGVRESDKESTSEYRLLTATMTIPEFTIVTAIRSNQSTEENEEPKTSCAEGDASCDSLDENTPRQKRHIGLFPPFPIPPLPRPRIRFPGGHVPPIFRPINKPNRNCFGPGHIPACNVRGPCNIRMNEKLQKEVQALTKKLQEAERNLALKDLAIKNKEKTEQQYKVLHEVHNTEVKIFNEKIFDLRKELDQRSANFRTTVEEGKKSCEKTLNENKERENRERETLQEAHNTEVKILKKKLADLREELDQQSRNFTTTVEEGKKSCEKTLNENKERENRERETLQEAHNTEVKILKKKLADLREELDQQSRNFTTTVEEGKKSCEKTLNENKERENRERETLQEAHNTEVKILKKKLADLREELDQQSRNFTTTVEEGKKSCEKTLNENKERENRERETLQEAHNTEVKILKKKLADLREELDQQSRNFTTTVEEGKKICETLHTEHAAEIESMEEMLMKEKQVSIGLEEKLTTQTTECAQNLETEKERWDNRLTEETKRSKKELAEITELHEICVADKEKKNKQRKELKSFGLKI